MKSRLSVDVILSALGLTGSAACIEGLAAAPTPTPDRLQWAYRAAGIGLDDLQALEATVIMDEQLQPARIRAVEDLDMGRFRRNRVFRAAVTLFDSSEGVQVDDELTGRLPLLPLAAEIARLQPAGRLTVRSGADGTGCGGLYARTSSGGVVLLDAELVDEDLAVVFAHELAHAVDPAVDVVDSEGAEAFAYHLETSIIRDTPASLSELAPLIANSLETTRGRRRPAKASQDVEELLTFIAVEVAALEPVVDVGLIAAHRGDP